MPPSTVAALQAGWLRLNMGNIHLEQEQYAQAVKMYRMALDQLPPALKRMRLNVQRNVGIAFLRAGRFQVGRRRCAGSWMRIGVGGSMQHRWVCRSGGLCTISAVHEQMQVPVSGSGRT
jgi:hypothetical protein